MSYKRNLHVAIFNMPTPVHINPTHAIVATLIRRGYRVSYVASDEFAPGLARLGAEIIPAPGMAAARGEGPQRSVHYMSLLLAAASTFYEQNPPDLILYDALAYAGLMLATRLGIPAIRMTTQLDETHAQSLLPESFMQKLRDRRRLVAAFLADEGHKGAEEILYGVDTPSIYFYLKDLQLGTATGKRSIFAARCAAERPQMGQWKSQNSDQRPLILISTSTAMVQGTDYYKTCVAALQGLNWHAVLAFGKEIDVSELEPLPPHAEAAQNVPQLLIMPHASAMICLGGPTTTAEAMYHGLPMIMITHGHPDPEMYAENNQNHGLGIHLRGSRVSSDDIRNAVSRIASDPAIRESVQRTQIKVKKSPGAESVVNWIEEFLEAPSAEDWQTPSAYSLP